MEAQEPFSVNIALYSKHRFMCALGRLYFHVNSCLAVTADVFSLWVCIQAGQEVVCLPKTVLLDFSNRLSDLNPLWQIPTWLLVWL